jgi:carboxyl-terminal processing protease
MNKAKIALQFVLYTVICIVVVGAAYAMGYAMRSAHAPATGDVAEFGVFWEAWQLVNDHFYGDTTDTTQRTYGAIRGSMQALDDPYTLFVEPQQRDREQEELRGSFGGIGAWVERAPDGRILLTPMDGRPAQEAGVQSGDELIAVDGTSVTPEMPFDDVLALVRGEAGAIVVLTVRREGVEDPIDIEVERAEIVTPSVTYELKEEDVGYIHILIFGERTADELEDAARDLKDQGATSYIIDLRDNGGGLLPAAVDVASQFLREGVVLYERKSDGTEKAFDVHGRGILRDDPVVFLVNNATASASEIVAGAIQDYERGVLIGTETYGKASVQFIFDLSDGSSVHITNARWLTPNRQEIDGVGLTPDIVVPITQEDYEAGRDPQVDQAIAYLKDNP